MGVITSGTKGVFVIAATPFTPQGAIDMASIDTMVEFYMARGADGLTVLGMQTASYFIASRA